MAQNDLTAWIDRTLVDENGDQIGTIHDIYVDDETRQPEWLAVKTGMFGKNVSFVPLEGASSDGDVLVTQYDKALIKDAPNVEPDGMLSPEEEQALYRHYGRGSATTQVQEDAPGTVGHDTSGPTTDTAMTRSEEELRVGTQDVEAGRVRLRKYVVTEHESVTVPVRKERVRIEREPITEGNVAAATDGPAISEEEHEIVLHEERPVVATEAVPKERVRLDKDTEIEEQTVGADVRKEQIELVGDVPQGARR